MEDAVITVMQRGPIHCTLSFNSRSLI